MKIKSRQAGFSLIEIMIALLIGAFILGGLIKLFVNSHKTSRMQENLSRLQENGRFAMEYLSRDIRMAGYWDCMSPSTPNNQDVVGTEGGGAATPDSITLRAAYARTKAAIDPCGTMVTQAATVACPQGAAPANFYADNSSRIIYSIFTDANNDKFLHRVTACNDNLDPTEADIVEGVENLQILYGIETDATNSADYFTPNYYVTANNIPDLDGNGVIDWHRVFSIRVTLTMTTPDTNLVQTTAANPDGRIRRNFTSTIAVRNRLP